MQALSGTLPYMDRKRRTVGDSTISAESMSLVDDAFWSSRITTVRNNTLPSMYKLLKDTGRWDLMNMRVIEGAKPHHFWDSDLAKFLEAVCYSLKYMDSEDPLLPTFHAWIDELTAMIIKAQQPDGYINSYYTVMEPENKLKNITEKHELYCLGHLLEAAIAHRAVTGKEELLDAMCRYLDLVADMFGPEEGKIHGYPGHQEIELAIARLLEFRWFDKYYKLLDYFVEQRGYNDGEFFDQQANARGVDPHNYIPSDPIDGMVWWPKPRMYSYYQAETLIRDTCEVKDHSVRQFYFLTGVQRLAMLKDDDTLRDAVNRLWHDTVSKKLYIHGGIGSIYEWEGFGEPYDLRWDGYSETCASISLIFCAQAILHDRLDSDVAYVMERALYNDVLGGVSLDGKAYYYDQPITGAKGLKRKDWFECSCCPPNVARLFNNLQDYVFSTVKDTLALNLYIGGVYNVGGANITVKTDYPNGGNLGVGISTSKPTALAIRAPKTKYTVSSDDYTLKDGYLLFPAKVWDHEKIVVDFELEITVVEPHPLVEANKGCLALEYGPFVYALESFGVALDDVRLEKSQKFEKEIVELDGCKFWQLSTRQGDLSLRFVPYFITSNKSPGEDFRIWLKEA